MTDDKKEDEVKVRCPKCGAEVVVDAKAQSAGAVTCPKGHTVELMKAF